MRMRDILAVGTVGALLGTAIRRELQQPPRKRTWTGTVAGVPYDLRTPDMQRLRTALWNPEDPRYLVDQPFGLGWTVNLGRFARPRTVRGRLRRRRASS